MPTLRMGGQVIAFTGTERLLDLADDGDEPLMSVGCRAAHCGHCLVRVEAPGGAVVPANRAELETLAALNPDLNPDPGPDPGPDPAPDPATATGLRLGCQLVLTGEGDVHIAAASNPAPVAGPERQT